MQQFCFCSGPELKNGWLVLDHLHQAGVVLCLHVTNSKELNCQKVKGTYVPVYISGPDLEPENLYSTHTVCISIWNISTESYTNTSCHIYSICIKSILKWKHYSGSYVLYSRGSQSFTARDQFKAAVSKFFWLKINKIQLLSKYVKNQCLLTVHNSQW